MNFQLKDLENSTKIIPVLPLLHQPEVTCSLSGTVTIIGDNDIQQYKTITWENETCFCVLKQAGV